MAQPQSPFSAQALLTRLQTVFSDAPKTTVMGAADHPAGTIRTAIPDVFALIVHEVDGWPSRNQAQGWVNDYTSAAGTGKGPQGYVSYDGTVQQLVDWPRVIWHAEFMNGRSIGNETGHGGDARFESGTVADPPPDIAPDTVGGTVRRRWTQLSNQPEDVPGAKLFVVDQVAANPHEVMLCWWTASTYTTANADNYRYLVPAREAPGTVGAGAYNGHPSGPPPAPTLMIFSEAQYRSWALLARFLCETFVVPRNFVLFPWVNRSDNIDNPAAAGASPIFRQIVLADPNFSPIVRDLAALGFGFNEAMFDPTNLAQFRRAYNAAILRPNTIPNEPAFGLNGNNKRLNYAWLTLFKKFRGFVGHGFSGAARNGHDDHDCPGPMFNWYRFAREVWDWWWYPFDFDPAFTTAAVAMRGYFLPTKDTPLVE
jgi:hypothetical protein